MNNKLILNLGFVTKINKREKIYEVKFGFYSVYKLPITTHFYLQIFFSFLRGELY